MFNISVGTLIFHNFNRNFLQNPELLPDQLLGSVSCQSTSTWLWVVNLALAFAWPALGLCRLGPERHIIFWSRYTKSEVSGFSIWGRTVGLVDSYSRFLAFSVSSCVEIWSHLPLTCSCYTLLQYLASVYAETQKISLWEHDAPHAHNNV